MAQSMLLTKNLTHFLSQNTTPALPHLMLLSPTGKLLSSSSPLPASKLRTQATLACSLWTLYDTSASAAISSALPLVPSPSSGASSDPLASSTSTMTESELRTITIQLSHGIMVIRALSCDLLFVAIGPNTSLRVGCSSSTTSPPKSPGVEADGGGGSAGSGISSGLSDMRSMASTGSRTSSIFGIKRQADEVGQWLDRQLEGFALYSGEGR